ncbi:MAG: Rpn family recombination-promoting nuclease/putative transposase [Butyrivibrio sp.]|nr:Rpn family recombination-promoting nuclease/putative transposase [Butyrivibrio sp.]
MSKSKNKSSLTAKTFQNATGKIDYTLTDSGMFQIVMCSNNKTLTGLLCALLHLKPEEVKSVTILNPFEYGKVALDKTFILDVKIELNNAAFIDIELQVRNQDYWSDRSLSYLCRLFDQLDAGEPYSNVKPAYHIGILDFTLFPKYPEFYATNKMMNVKKHYIYNDKFTLNVLDLNQIELATDEDKQWKLDYWARLFKATTWEELKMLAQKDPIFQETGQIIFQKNQDKKAREWCEFLRQDAERVRLTDEYLLQKKLEELTKAIEEAKAELAEKESTITEKESVIAERESVIAEKESDLTEKESTIEQQQAQIEQLRAEIQKLKEAQKQ